MTDTAEFELSHFLPYLLNQAAESSSRDFQKLYKDRYGMLRTEWRVLFHLGRHGAMTAKDICDRAMIHKTKVSRAVRALQDKRFLQRKTLEHDRRNEALSLTVKGTKVFEDLTSEAAAYDERISGLFKAEEREVLLACLLKIAKV